MLAAFRALAQGLEWQGKAGEVEGGSSLAIAKALEISRHTVYHYTERVLLKLGVGSRGEVLAKFLWG